MKPPFAYFGGKTVLADRIVSLLPEHKRHHRGRGKRNASRAHPSHPSE